MNKLLTLMAASLFFCLILHGAYASPVGVTVNITESGFSPDYIEVQEGESVTWVNQGNSEHWPASNFHPTHAAYPGSGIEKCGGTETILDACKGLKPGESFTFTFGNAGQWGVHDHLYPVQQMTVKVTSQAGKKSSGFMGLLKHVLGFLGIGKSENKAQSSKSTLPAATNASAEDVASEAYESCKNLKEKFSCYATQMQHISYSHGDKYAFTVLAALQAIDPVANGCHFISHGIGWGAYARDPSNWQDLIAGSSPACSYGEQMGIIELYTQNLPEGKLTKEHVPTLCGEHPRADCNHAVGHMMLLEADNNLSKAISLCSGLGNGTENFQCLTGMFMERFIASNLIEHGVVPKSWGNWPARLPSDEELCRTFTGNYSVACWREIAHPALYYFKDPKKIFDYCDTAPSLEAANQCKNHALPELMTPYKFNLSELRKVCALENQTDPTFEKGCYLSIVGIKIALVGHGSKDLAEYCYELAPELIPQCLRRVKGTLKYVQVTD